MIQLNDEDYFKKNISEIVKKTISDINKFQNIFPIILSDESLKLFGKKPPLKISDEVLQCEIYYYFSTSNISERTVRAIRSGIGPSSSALNICYIAHTLNILVDKINAQIIEHNSDLNKIKSINLNKLFALKKQN